MDRTPPETQSPEIERWYRQLGRIAFHFGTIEHQTYVLLWHLGSAAIFEECRKRNLNQRLVRIETLVRQHGARLRPTGRTVKAELLLIGRTKDLAETRNSILHSSVVADGPLGEGIYTIALMRMAPSRRVTFDELKAFADEVKSTSEDWLLGFAGLSPAAGG